MKAVDSIKRQWAKIRSLKWMNSPGFMAQAGHGLLGLASVHTPYALFQTWIASAIGTAVVIAYMIRKETHEDPLIEDEGFWPEGAKDILFSSFGQALGWLTLGAAGRI